MRSTIAIRASLVLAAIGLGGCGYTSDYRPPNDGRARVLFHDTTAVASIPATSEECLDALAQPPSPSTYRLRRRASGGVYVYWSPEVDVHIYGSSSGGSYGRAAGGSHVSAPGSRTLATPGVRSGSSGGHASGGHSSGGHASGGGKAGSGGGSHSGGGGGGGGGEALVVLAVAAIVLMPAVTMAVIFTPAVSEDESAKAIDRVNAYNDLARMPGSPCAPPSLAVDPDAPVDPDDSPPGAPEAPPEGP